MLLMVVRMSVRMSVGMRRRGLLEVRLRIVRAWAWIRHHRVMRRSAVHGRWQHGTR